MHQPSVTSGAITHAIVTDSPLYNDDLAPTGPAQRTWKWYHFTALWIGMVMNLFRQWRLLRRRLGQRFSKRSLMLWVRWQRRITLAL